MKIGIINSLYKPYTRGGAEVVVQNIANGLKDKGQDVFVISTKPLVGKVGIQDFEPPHQIKIYRFFPFNLFSVYHINKFKGFLGTPLRLIWHGLDMLNLYSYFKIKKILNQEKPDVVMTHNLMGLGFLIPRLVRQLKIKHIQTMHDVQLVYPSGLLIKGQENSFFNKFFLTKWWQKLNRQLFASPDVVVFPSKWLKEFYQTKGFFKDSKLVVLYNPISFNTLTVNLDQLISGPTLDPRLRGDDSVNFLFVGQIEQHKGINFLIKVFQLLITNYQLLITLHIVGSGTQLNQAKQLANQNPNIKFYGHLPYEQVLELYNKTDCVVVPSFCYENSPTVIYESLSRGRPVVASNLGGIGELIQSGENGWLFEAGKTESLIEVMQMFVALPPEDKDKIKKNCLESIKEYSLNNYIERLLDLC